MCISKNITKPIETTINEKGEIKLSVECSNERSIEYHIEGHIEGHIEDAAENSTENTTAELGNVAAVNYVPRKFEKLLTNISNKLGLSFAIYQK